MLNPERAFAMLACHLKRNFNFNFRENLSHWCVALLVLVPAVPINCGMSSKHILLDFTWSLAGGLPDKMYSTEDRWIN